MKHQPISFHLLKPPVWGTPFNPMGSVTPLEVITLTPRHYSKTWLPRFVDSWEDVYTIYSPQNNRVYEDWEIQKMRDVCASFKVRFQLHPPSTR